MRQFERSLPPQVQSELVLYRTYLIHWASKETYHFFRATCTKIQSIKMNHIWTQISYSTPYWAYLKQKGLRESKRRKLQWNRKRSLFWNHRNCSPPGLNKHWTFWIGRLSWRFTKQIVWFFYFFILRFTTSPFLIKQIFVFLDVLDKE